jgi:hypothetical protein
MRTYLNKCQVSPDHVTLQADHQSPCRRKVGNGNGGTNQLAAILGRLTSLYELDSYATLYEQRNTI